MYWEKHEKNYGNGCLGWPLNRVFLLCSSGRTQCRKACLPQQSMKQHVQYYVSSVVMNGEGCGTWISVAYFTACSTKTDFHDVRNLYCSHKTVRLPSYYVRHATNSTKMWNKTHCNVGSRVSWIATGTMRYVHRLDSALKHKSQVTELFSSCTQKSSRQRMFDVTPLNASRWGPMFKPSDRLPSILTCSQLSLGFRRFGRWVCFQGWI